MPLLESLHNARRFLSLRGFLRDHVRFGSSVLPAKHLRFGGAEFKDDAFFVASGKSEAGRLVNKCAVTSSSRVLDVGCGMGRLPIGILSLMENPPRYFGVDVDFASVDWCRRHVGHGRANFRFDHINVLNERYNPKGTHLGKDFRLPYEDCSLDLIYLYSVFSHMMPEDVQAYLREFRRLLVPTGQVFLTAFVEEKVPDVMENPSNYRMKWGGALHCVRYEKGFFESLIAACGFRIHTFEYERETNGQSALYLSCTGEAVSSR